MVFNFIREALYTLHRDDTLEVIKRDYIAERLGEASMRLTEALENSFFMPNRGGVLEIPEQEETTHNVGVHMLTMFERSHPAIPYESALKPQDAQYLQAHLGIKDWENFSHSIAFQEGRMPDNTPACIVTTPQWLFTNRRDSSEGYDYTYFTRPIILARQSYLTTAMDKGEKLRRAGILAHEFDHALQIMNWGSADPTRQRTLAYLRSRVLLERSAHTVMANILLPESIDLGQEIDRYSDVIQQMSPTAAGEYINSLRSLMDRAVGALALTRVFSEGQAIPTQEEIEAYTASEMVF